jgi:hypothetical protein
MGLPTNYTRQKKKKQYLFNISKPNNPLQSSSLHETEVSLTNKLKKSPVFKKIKWRL